MKLLLLISAILLLIGVAPMPIGYYTLLRIVVTIGAVAVVITEFENGLNPWVLIFGLIVVLFNPLIPVYFNDKSIWTVIDIIVALLFAGKIISLTYFKTERDG